MNRVINNVKPIITWFDGVCCKPNACRRIAITTTMRVNEVIIMTAAGIKLSAVIKIKICKVTEYSCDPSALVVNFNADNDNSSAQAPKLKLNKEKTRMKNNDIFFMVMRYSLQNKFLS